MKRIDNYITEKLKIGKKTIQKTSKYDDSELDKIFDNVGDLINSLTKYFDDDIEPIEYIKSKGLFIPSHGKSTTQVDSYFIVCKNKDVNSNEQRGLLFGLINKYLVVQAFVTKDENMEDTRYSEVLSDKHCVYRLGKDNFKSYLHLAPLQEIEILKFFNML